MGLQADVRPPVFRVLDAVKVDDLIEAVAPDGIDAPRFLNRQRDA